MSRLLIELKLAAMFKADTPSNVMRLCIAGLADYLIDKKTISDIYPCTQWWSRQASSSVEMHSSAFYRIMGSIRLNVVGPTAQPECTCHSVDRSDNKRSRRWECDVRIERKVVWHLLVRARKNPKPEHTLYSQYLIKMYTAMFLGVSILFWAKAPFNASAGVHHNHRPRSRSYTG